MLLRHQIRTTTTTAILIGGINDYEKDVEKHFTLDYFDDDVSLRVGFGNVDAQDGKGVR